MFQFILTTVLMSSLGTMLYLVARSLPRLDEKLSDKPGILERISSSEIPEKIDAAFNNFLSKFLRRVKVILMKIDNFINEKLKRVSPNGNGKPSANRRIDFKELNGVASSADSEQGEKETEQVLSDIEKTSDSDNN